MKHDKELTKANSNSKNKIKEIFNIFKDEIEDQPEEIQILNNPKKIKENTDSNQLLKSPETIPSNNYSRIDNIFETQGYNRTTYKIIFLVICILIVEGAHMTLFSSIIIPLTKFYSLSDTQITIISSILFFGVGLGSFISGSSSIKFGRPFIINLFMLTLLISNIIMGLTHNFVVFGLTRFIVGFCIGIIVPMSLNLLAEYLPLKFRSLVLTGVWTGFGIGQILLLLIMLTIMPNLQMAQVGNVILIASIIPLFTLIMTFFLLQDSPRNLILICNEKKAIEILEKIMNKKIEEENAKSIILEVRSGTNGELSNSIHEVFNSKFLYLTILLSFIWFFNSMITYGPLIVSTLTMNALGIKESFTNRQIIVSQIIINLIGLPGSVIGGILSDIPSLGRRISTALSFFLCIIILICVIIFPSQFTLLFGLLMGIGGIAFNINTTYSCEVYPTKIRDQAIGFLFFCTRIGGVSSQIFYLQFEKMGIWWPYYFTIIFMGVNLVLVLLLPFETHGQFLDADYHKTKKIEIN